MIQYPVALRELSRIVSRQLPTIRNRDGKPRKNGRIAWRLQARQQTQQLRGTRAYNVDRENEIWPDLKDIFERVQGGKCAFCEKKLPVHKSGRVEGDIEHYRPKNGVVAWPTTHLIPIGRQDADCYYLLAFHLRNYLLACGICNQDYKRNYFPIAGPRCPAHSCRPRDLAAERPYLLHPLDPNEENPEELIEFIGIVPIPRAAKGSPSYWRAVVTIELLGLTGGNRLDLDLERAETIARVFLALELRAIDGNDPVAAKTVSDLTNDAMPHRNCARSFKRLYDNDPSVAAYTAQQALKFVDSVQRERQVN